jgi:rRNA maturation RNase YbeY
VNIIFCSEAYLLAMNQKYLEHDYHTDILTFPYGDQKNISGDLFISVDMAHYNAAGYNISFEYEILRVVAHGLLHLLGYNDKSEKDQKEMRFIEEKWLKSLSDFHKQGKLPVGFTWNKKSISS